ncbi:hypothetical protein GCM10009799_04810 [Nocardiopsis rhodophaea]|uniref:Uncharacterized protein n=1 Tax=Nocardiopsis rhodophaea TaxID=280238 RepID=A0ABN2S963_9ACTN
MGKRFGQLDRSISGPDTFQVRGLEAFKPGSLFRRVQMGGKHSDRFGRGSARKEWSDLAPEESVSCGPVVPDPIDDGGGVHQDPVQVE